MCALSTFKEAGEEERHKRYRTIHVQECVQVMLEGDDRLEPLIPTQLSQKPAEKKQRGKVIIFILRTIKLWNNLPVETQSCTDFKLFKQLILPLFL